MSASYICICMRLVIIIWERPAGEFEQRGVTGAFLRPWVEEYG